LRACRTTKRDLRTLALSRPTTGRPHGANLANLTVPSGDAVLPPADRDAHGELLYGGELLAAADGRNDYYEWNDAGSASSNRRILPGGFGITCLDSTPNDGTWNGTAVTHACDSLGTVYAIKVWWIDDRRTGLATTDPNAYLRVVTTLQPQP
jgi:hypothetical protein